jgi:hypothetical protein
MLLNKGQYDYSIIVDLGKQPANITMGQLIAHCPSLRRKLNQGTNTRRSDPSTTEIRITNFGRKDMRSPQVQAIIAGRDASGCLVDGGAAVNSSLIGWWTIWNS